MTKLSDLLGTRTIDCDVFGHTVTVTYQLGERLPGTSSIDPFESVVVTMVKLVESWDLEGDDGKPVPITEEALGEVPVPALRRVLNQILGDDGLGEASSSSNAG